MAGTRPALDALVAALPGAHVHAPRSAALLLLASADGGGELHADGDGASLMVHELQHTTLSLVHTARAAPAPAPRLERAFWPHALYHADGTRVTLPAVPDELVPACTAALRRLGRVVTFTEPCTTWEAPPELWRAAGAGFDDAAAPLDWRALAAAVGLPAGLRLAPLVPADAPALNAQWKYAAGAATEAVIRDCIARFPCVGARRCSGSEGGGEGAARPSGSEAEPGGATAAASSPPPPAAAAAAADGALVGWMVTRYDGSSGILHVADAHRGRGVARALVTALAVLQRRWLPTLRGSPPGECDPHLPALPPAASLLVADPSLRRALTGHVLPHAHVATYNVASERLFASLGWRQAGRCTWLVSTQPAARLAMRPLRLAPAVAAALAQPHVAGGGGGGRRGEASEEPQPQPQLQAPGGCRCPNHTHSVCSAPLPPGVPPHPDPAAPWLAFESPRALAAAPAELLQLLALINASYRQDDAFFVDQWRTCLADVLQAATSGVFFLGYRLAAQAGVDGGGGSGRGAWSDGLAEWGLRPAAFPAPITSSVDAGDGAGDVPTAALGGAGEHSDGASRAALGVAGVGVAGVAGVAGVVGVAGAAAAAAATAVFRETDELLVSVHLSFTDEEEQPLERGAEALSTARGRVVALSLLTVDPRLKKQGLAARVLDFALRTAKDTYGCVAAEVHVVSVKPWLLDFYVRQGFTVVGRDEWPAQLAHQLLRPTFFHRCRKQL